MFHQLKLYFQSQPKRGLPGKAMFEVAQPINDPYPNLYHFANKCQLLQSLLVLLSSAITGHHPVILSCVKTLLQLLLRTHHGLLYLSSQTEVTNGIIKFLLHIPVSSFNLIGMFCFRDFCFPLI